MWADCPAVTSVAEFKEHKEDKDIVSGASAQSAGLNVPNCDGFNWFYEQKFSL